MQSITEALRYVPGVYTSSGGADPRFDLFTIRGFSNTGADTYRDGLETSAAPTTFTLFRNNPYGVERIDVLRGPSSVLYGQGGPGGLINIVSKKPTEVPFAEVYGLLGSAKRKEAGFDLGGALDKDAHYLARLTGMVREGQAQVPYFSNFIPDDRYFIAPAFTWRPSDDTKLTILADVGHEVTGNNFALTIARLGIGGVVGVRPTTLFLGDPGLQQIRPAPVSGRLSVRAPAQRHRHRPPKPALWRSRRRLSLPHPDVVALFLTGDADDAARSLRG